jgi:hypothetical protein
LLLTRRLPKDPICAVDSVQTVFILEPKERTSMSYPRPKSLSLMRLAWRMESMLVPGAGSAKLSGRLRRIFARNTQKISSRHMRASANAKGCAQQLQKLRWDQLSLSESSPPEACPHCYDTGYSSPGHGAAIVEVEKDESGGNCDING